MVHSMVNRLHMSQHGSRIVRGDRQMTEQVLEQMEGSEVLSEGSRRTTVLV